VRALDLAPGTSPGVWARYRVRVQSRGHPAREFTQRVAVVSREGVGEQAGVWVELKTVDAAGNARIERGFFRPAHAKAAAESGQDSGEPAGMSLARYQAMASGGALYEFPLDADALAGSGPELSGLSLFQVEGQIPLDHETLGPDTLHVRDREFPATMERSRWIGGDEWTEPADSAAVYRTLLTRTVWRAAGVPVTGFARSTYEVTSQRFAPRDSTGALPMLPPREGVERAPLYRLELTLLDRGDDAVPEVTQEAEPAPEETASPELHGTPSR
jgi:hypothetical protein